MNIGPSSFTDDFLISGVRYSEGILTANQFLLATVPEPGRALLLSFAVMVAACRRNRRL